MSPRAAPTARRRAAFGPVLVELWLDAPLAAVAPPFDPVQGVPDCVLELRAGHPPSASMDTLERVVSGTCALDFSSDGGQIRGVCEPHPQALERALRFSTQRLLASRGWLVLHGATVVIRGEAHVLCAPSGTGKSTTARRLQALGYEVLGDEVALVGPSPDGRRFLAAVQPGQELSGNPGRRATLAGVHVLERGRPARQVLKPVSLAAELLRHAMVYRDAKAQAPLLAGLAATLAGAVPGWRTRVSLDADGLAALEGAAREAA